MKLHITIKKLGLCLSALIPGMLSGDVVLQEWTFDVPNGTTLDQAVNTGDPGGWIFDAGLTANQASVVNGALRVHGASVASPTAANVISDLGFTSGEYQFSFTITDFDLFSVIEPGATLAWVQLLVKSNGANVVLIRVEEDRQGFLRIWARPPAPADGDPTIFPITTGTFFPGPITVTATVNMDDGTVVMAVDSPESGISTSVGPLPLQNYEPGDPFTGLGITSNFSVERSSSSDYIEFGEIRVTGPEVAVELWAGYEVDQDGWIDTGDFMGQLNVELDPWIWSSELERWIYMSEENVTDTGAWFYAATGGQTDPVSAAETNSWAGYVIDGSGWVDTGDFMGYLFIEIDSWVWSLEEETWFYVPEETVSNEGGWVFTLM